jgi:alpha-mannosidase
MPTRPTLHLICQAHLDPVWLWPTRDGAAEALTTIDSAVNRMRENPRMKFTRSSAQVYRWIEESDPRLFAEIRRLVKAGRWETIGGWIEQPDCNLPSTESICRHSLYGGNYFTSRFGEAGRVRAGYNVDSFGHAGGFPQLLKQSGFDAYVFMRPQKREAPDLPDLFWWGSEDGSRVLCQRVPGEYSQNPSTTADQLDQIIREQWPRHFSPGFDHGIFWLGIGNHGGGPTKEHLARIAELQKDPTLPVLKFSTVRGYLAEVLASPAAKNLPLHEGELQHHARGCYAAWSDIKQLNRNAERRLVAAETASQCAGIDKSLEPAWWSLLFNQFHDILAGTCTIQTSAETRNRFGAAIDAADDTLRHAVHRMARRIDTSHLTGNTLFAFNPLPWAREVEVTLDTFTQPHGREKITHLVSTDGRRIPIQWLAADSNFGPHLMPWGKLCARLPLPASGYSIFHLGLEPVAAAPKKTKALPAPKNPVRLVVLPDHSDTWAHGVKAFSAKAVAIPLGRAKVIEQGPWTTIVRHSAVWNRSSIQLDVVARANEPALELRLRINWQEPRSILRLEWPTGIKEGEWVSQTIGGRSTRKADGDEQPAQNWTAFAKGKCAAVLVNHGSGSVSARKDVISTIVARSTPYAEHDPMPYPDLPETPYTDQGWQERRFWTLSLDGESPLDAADRVAASLLTGAETMLDSCHPGDWPMERSFFAIEPAEVNLLCLKKSETGKAWIARLHNPTARSLMTTVRVDGYAKPATIQLKPHRIITLEIAAATKADAKGAPKWRELDLNENPIAESPR